MSARPDRLVPGAARASGESLRDLLMADGRPPPDVLLTESYEFLGDADIAFERYTSPEFAAAEAEHLWPRVWQWSCRAEHIPEPGDYYVHDVGDLSALIVRTASGEIMAYANACMHRGTQLKPPGSCGWTRQLKPPGSCGWTRQLKCPFHGWTWSLDGRLVHLPDAWDFPHASAESHRLAELAVDTRGGFVFVNFDSSAGPRRDFLGVLPEHFARWPLEERYIETHVCKRLPANWKAAAEAFLEAYHGRETHAAGAAGTDVHAQYDVFGPNVSRFIHTIATRNPAVQPPLSEQEHLARIMGSKLDGAPVPELPPGTLARDFYAAWHRYQLSARYGRDLSHLSTSEPLDSIEYFLFPNAFFFPGLTLPMACRFRPDGRDPDHSLFDLLILRPSPEDGPAPAPAEVVRLEVGDSYTQVESLGNLGRVFDEDTVNMGAQTRGFKASRKRGQALGNYQEVRVRHLHLRVDDYLDRDSTNNPNPVED